MARVALTVNALVPNSSISEAAGDTADPTNDHYIPAGYQPEELLIRFANTNGSDRVATVAAGDDPPAASAGQGNLDVTVPATTGVKWVGGLTGARFLQNDGTINIDLAASFAGTVTVYHLPRTA